MKILLSVVIMFLACTIPLVIIGIPIGIATSAKSRRLKATGLSIYFFILLLLILIGYYRLSFEYHEGFYTGCQKNLTEVGTELKIYSTDNDGLFPGTLEQMDPDIRKRRCSHAGDAVCFYGEYEVSADRKEYTLFCKGQYHRGPPNYPQYTSRQGLIAPEHKFGLREIPERF